MEPLGLPNTDSPEVMEQVVSVWLTHIIWQHLSRYHTDDMEEQLLLLYSRVFKAVRQAHQA